MKIVKRTIAVMALGAVIAAPVVAQLPTERDPIPLAEVTSTIDFLEVKGLPTWFEKPAGVVDRVSFATIDVDESADHACVGAAGDAKRAVRNVLFEHLLPALGTKDTMALLEPLIAEATLVSAELGTIVVKQGAGGEDRRAIACLGWRAPLRKVLAKFEPQHQGRIEWLLLRPVVHWRPVSEPPKWAGSVPKREGYLRCAFMHDSNEAQASAIAAARRDVQAHLVKLLTPAVGKQRATVAAVVGIERIGAVARAYRVIDRSTVGRFKKEEAYCLWEVPMAPMLLTLPKGLRKVAAYQLQ